MVAGDAVLTSGAFARFTADDHQAGRDPDATLQRPLGMVLQALDRVDDLEAAANGGFSGVFTGVRPAEVGEHPIAEIFGDPASGRRDLVRHELLVAGQQFTQHLRIDFHRHAGRADEVDEHDRDLTAFGCGGRGDPFLGRGR